MRRILIVTLLIAALDLHAQRGNPEVWFEGQTVDSMIAAFMKEHGVAGMSVAIVQAPYITRATGFGLADTQRRTLVSANTLFNIAQMRNAYTAVAVMQLVESGKLALDDTLRELLRDPAAYARLEALIEKASGQTYEAFVEKNQFERLGLKHTFFGGRLGSTAREDLRPGERHRRFLREAVFIDPTEPAIGYRDDVEVASSPRAIYASAIDISIWDIGLAGEILIKDPALRKVLYTPGAGATSGPWFFPGHEGLMVTTGSAEGFSSLLSRFTKSDELVCVTLLANEEGLDLTQLARKIAGAHNPKIGPPSRAEGMRVQQSPYGLKETLSRIETLAGATAWEENGEVWIAAPDVPDAAQRRNLDAALLRAVMP